MVTSATCIFFSFHMLNDRLRVAVPQYAVGRQELYKRFPQQYDLLCKRQDKDSNIPKTLSRIGVFGAPGAGPRTILDIGAGTGKLSRIFAQCEGAAAPSGVVCLGVDRVFEMVRYGTAQAQLLSQSSVVSFALSDTRRLPVRDKAVDVAVAGWTLSEIKSAYFNTEWEVNIRAALSEMERVSREMVVVLENLSVGEDEPLRKGSHFYDFLEKEAGFSKTWIRTDYEFIDDKERRDLIRFFFGNKRSEKLFTTLPDAPSGPAILKECTGMWWKCLG